MIMASLLDLGADLRAVRQAVESVGCRLEVSRQERSSIVACRAPVTSHKLFHSLAEPDSILQASGLKGSAPDSAIRVLLIWLSRRVGCLASPRSRPISTRWGRWSAASFSAREMRRRCRGASSAGNCGF